MVWVQKSWIVRGGSEEQIVAVVVVVGAVPMKARFRYSIQPALDVKQSVSWKAENSRRSDEYRTLRRGINYS